MPHSKANILVIEDHAVVQLGINTLLSTCTSINLIDRASSGKEAIGKFQHNDFDIVLIDVELPDMSGFDLLSRLRQHHPTVKVLFYSMHEEYWVIKEMFNSEADGIVMKSDRLDELRTAVDTIIAGGKYFSKEYGLFLKEYEQQEELTPQESKVLRLVGEGITSQQIAQRLFVSVNTIEFHRRHIMRKLGVSNMASLVKVAIEKGYIKHSKFKMEE
ncbi:MAG: response regulator transcription factor [Prevotella sp.]|nr:response regulator transcription factor [Prevotella sp.]